MKTGFHVPILRMEEYAVMANQKTASRAGQSFQKLKQDLAAGTVGNAYIFCGEESYLREYYLGALRKKLGRRGRT